MGHALACRAVLFCAVGTSDARTSGSAIPAWGCSELIKVDIMIQGYGCKSKLLQNLSGLGFKEPTPIQRQAIPVLLSGRECFACAPTGSGKTLAFLFPILMKIKLGTKDGVKAVILCPTVEYLVLDESDKLFELGFVEQIDSVVKACLNPSIIRSLFSATLPDSVEELARSIMHEKVNSNRNSASELIKQKPVFAGSEKGKLLALRQSFAESLNPPVLVFVQSKETAKELYKELAFDDIKADVIHADLTQQQREDAVDNFRAGNTWVLIATDVISRGMDFKGVNCVINYDFPESAAAYIHRIGRSGRAGRTGEAITFYTEEDKPFLRNIANVMAASGCEVPSWIMALPKLKRKKHRPKRDSISTLPEDNGE
uniref:RNA helicase n=1 Tax=Ananas comosus var. bracteatus TaxID=296719 RepID=A0A6V7PS49_ANACO|nr:unnamed protein product [Ananas comosus var. bracteatus]